VWLWRRQQRRWRARSDLVGVAALYERLLQVLRSAGSAGASPSRLAAPTPSQTPRELAEQAAHFLAGWAGTAGLAGVPARVVELLYRARWGGEALADADLAAVGRQLDSLHQALAEAGK
jgi:hypothetical protein